MKPLPLLSPFLPGPRRVNRIVEPELLDELPPDDLRAIHSRRDLRLLNWAMRHAVIFCDVLSVNLKRPPQMIVDIGAGDGTLALELATRMHEKWPEVSVTLVDRQNTVSSETLDSFQEYGWQARMLTADVRDWLYSSGRVDVVLANLFLHHFGDAKLKELFRLLAAKTDLFVACETQRDRFATTACRLLGLLGCNSVTRHDAKISVRAGFLDNELSELWPDGRNWKLDERRAFAFTHLFIAQRATQTQ